MSATATCEVPLTLMDQHDPELFAQSIAAIERVAAKGAFTGGAAVEEFESDYASWCECPHAIAVSSGTDALILALRALGIEPGDEVIVPANSFIATAEAVSLVGARPRFADVDRDTQVVTVETLQAAFTPRVRCVIPVHLYGRTVELEPIVSWAHAHGVLVLEDAAQAHGARARGRRVGTVGDAGAFSFYPAKNLGAWGDGGAVVTADVELAERVRLLRSHGEQPRYHHRTVGTTARLDAIQAAVLRVKLRHLEQWNAARRQAAEHLREAIGHDGTVVPPTPPDADGDHVYHQFVVRTPHRDAMRQLLAERGIATGVHYPIPIHRSRAYAAQAEPFDVAPTATKLAEEILSLPIFPAITVEQIERVGEALTQCAQQLDGETAMTTG